MSEGSFYFQHDYNARTDPKIKRLLVRHGYQGYGIYWAIIEDLYNNANALPTDYEVIAYDLRVDEDIVKSVVNDFDLFTVDGGKISSMSVQRRLITRGDKSAKARNSANAKWGNQSDNAKTRSERLSEARKKGTHTKQEWHEMRDFFGECVKCSSPEDIVKDHIIPIYQGGSDGIDNIQPLCRKCNTAKGPEDKDFRRIWCLRNACEMPAKWGGTPPIKGKERKGNNITPIVPLQNHKLQIWLKENCPIVSKLSKPLTFDEAEQVLAKHSWEFATNLFLDMENWKPLSKKSNSAYRTFVKWASTRQMDAPARKEEPFVIGAKHRSA